MRFNATDLFDYYLPSLCERRVALLGQGERPAPAGPYDEVLRRLGERHEAEHFRSLPRVENLAALPAEERAVRTRQALAGRFEALYQPLLSADGRTAGLSGEIIGVPDFLIQTEKGIVVREVKLARTITRRRHPAVVHQVQIYGWLVERATGRPPVRLEVLTGTGVLTEIPYDGGTEALQLLDRVATLRAAPRIPYAPVGWSKCTPCGFFSRCWPSALKRHDAALVVGVDQDLARTLREDGIHTYQALLGRFDETGLAAFVKRTERGPQRVGKRAAEILRSARALAAGEETVLSAPDLPGGGKAVMFDLEGLPPHCDELQKIYLWGTRLYTDRPGPYRAALAGFDVAGDRLGWETFLDHARDLFEDHGDVPFVHWAAYEKTHLRLYIERYGDPNGIGTRVLNNCFDLLEEVKRCRVLPLPSYGLKIVEDYVGFRRSQDTYGGDWSIAKYIEAVETRDADRRSELMEAIKIYNREDLEATWAVWSWLGSVDANSTSRRASRPARAAGGRG